MTFTEVAGGGFGPVTSHVVAGPSGAPRAAS